MPAPKSEVLQVRTSTDVVQVRQSVRALATEMGFSLIDQTKVVTAASELARNTLEHGGGGTAKLEPLAQGIRKGVRLTFEDQGPGISDVKLALTDGYTTGNGMGLGLSGSKRLVNEFDIDTQVGRGTRVTITKWK
ncbi:MAG TPA: anti-sigma regulatory factor [Tepidisphaeraceae bacterium]|jgi:serine/threonine-protein kinase RsbT|nr:anti-sigma regulatory factor [Tepidisphaeraceae bacterium]